MKSIDVFYVLLMINIANCNCEMVYEKRWKKEEKKLYYRTQKETKKNKNLIEQQK